MKTRIGDIDLNFKEEPVRFVNATPNDEFPVRILEAYLNEGFYACGTNGEQNQFTEAMNAAQEQRNAILRRAIEKLRRPTTPEER